MRRTIRIAVLTAMLAGLTTTANATTASPGAAAPTDLFFSEYIEGSSNNKALEIFNGTGAAIDLTAEQYVVQYYYNGNISAGATLTLSGTVADGDVFVLAHSSAVPEILAEADQASGIGFYNGDDAIVLRSGGADGLVLDSIGQIGVDPGSEWGEGDTSTANNTLRRKEAVTGGDTDPSDSFDPAATWNGYPQDTFNGLGMHPGEGDPPPPAVLTIGEVQGPGARSPYAPSSGNGSSAEKFQVRGVVTQRTLARTASGQDQHGFFLQSRLGTGDDDPATSEGIFVFMGRFPDLIGGYVPVVGDEIVVEARVAEFFFLTELTSASLVELLDTEVTDYEVTDAIPPLDLAAANDFWERHEGMQLRVRDGSGVVSGRDVFSSTADAEIWLVDRDDPTLTRTDPLTRRVYRDAHPLDGVFDGNGNRIMIGSSGVKWESGDNATLLPPARTFDILTGDAVGGLSYSFGKYGIQVTGASFTPGNDPSGNHPPSPTKRHKQFAVATFNVENLYDYRDDPFDGCDFVGNSGCPGVFPPFNYVPESESAYQAHLSALATQIRADLHSPDLLLVQEAEDQDICVVESGAPVCGDVDDADGKPDTLQELALAIAAGGGPSYDAAYDRDGADDRGIVSAFLFRTDRVSLAAPESVLTIDHGVSYRGEELAYNTDVQNPKSLNAVLPEDVDRSTGVDGANVYTRAPQVARFYVKARPGGHYGRIFWAVSNHYSSNPSARIGQRTEQALYGAQIVAAIEAASPDAKVIYGGDLNVFPRPDDPVSPPSDQLGPLYEHGLHNLWEDLPVESAYSYVFQGQAQTLDHLFLNSAAQQDFVTVRAAHVNADHSDAASDHDPQVAVFDSRGTIWEFLRWLLDQLR